VYPGETNVWVGKDGVNKIVACNVKFCSVELPDSYFINPGEITVRVYINDTLDNEVSFEVSSYLVCQVPRCVFCAAMWHDFACFPKEFQTFLIAGTVLSIVVSLVSISLCVKLICCIPWSNCQSAQGFSVKMKNVFTPKRDEQYTEEMEEIPRPIRQGGQRARLTDIRRLLGMQMLMMLVLTASACSSGISISGSAVECTVMGSDETCNVVLNQMLTIAAPGQTACISVQNEDGYTVGDITVKYDEALIYAPLATQYYTSGWGGVSTSNRQCAWESGCWDSSYCAAYNGVTHPTADGKLDGIATLWPGLSQCFSSCGCAGCGCGSCDSACLYSRYAFVPNGPVWRVSTPTFTRLEPKLTITLNSNGLESSLTSTVMGITQPFATNYTVHISGSLQGDNTVFGGEAIVSSEIGAYFSSASPVNSPIAGGIGDIQSNSPDKLITASRNAFIYPANAVSSAVGSYSVAYTFPSQGIETLSARDPLPQQKGTTLWSYTPTELVGLASNPGALLFQLNTINPVRFVRKVNIVCPRVDAVEVTGCYSCSQGARLKVMAISTCSEGSVPISITGAGLSLTTPSIMLDSNPEKLIYFNSDRAEVAGTLTIGVGDRKASIDFSGRLIADELITNHTGDVVNNPDDDNGGIDWITPFNDWFGNVGTTTRWIIIAAIVVGSILLLIGGVFVIKSLRGKSGYQKV